MRKRLGSAPAAQTPFEADAILPHAMLEPPRMMQAGQFNRTSDAPTERGMTT
ncbi:MAG: hypothetical protein ABW169_13890 [Sphingobium sp.]